MGDHLTSYLVHDGISIYFLNVTLGSIKKYSSHL